MPVEFLEARRLLHNGVDHSTAGPEHADDAGSRPVDVLRLAADAAAGRDHIPLSLFNTLPKELQDRINPHFVEDDRPLEVQYGDMFQNTPAARGISPSALEDALPDIVPLVGGSGGYLQPYLDTTEQPGHNLLRFSTAVGNMGDGPLILTSSNNAADIAPDGTQIVTQRIYARSGNSFVLNRSRVGGQFIWHPGHGHFHFEGYATYRLLHNVNGQPGDVVTRTDGTTTVGNKVGFCLINISSTFTIPGTTTSSSTLPNYAVTGSPATSCGFVQGIHVGRADVYSSIYDGQWIDVTGVPNGQYFLEVTMDGSDTVLEKDETNNTVRVPVTLNANPATGGIPADRFESPAPNNSFATATDLGVEGFENQPGLSIHANYDEDFFKFTAASTGTGTLATRATHGDVNIFLYDAAGTLLKISSTQRNGTVSNPDVDTITYSFVRGQTYYVRTAGLGTDTTAASGLSNNYTLELKIKATVVITPSATTVSEARPRPTYITISRNGPISSPLTVTLLIHGTATGGADYVNFPSSVIIGVEADSVTIPFDVIPDDVAESSETVFVGVLAGTNYTMEVVPVITIIDGATRTPPQTFTPLTPLFLPPPPPPPLLPQSPRLSPPEYPRAGQPSYRGGAPSGLLGRQAGAVFEVSEPIRAEVELPLVARAAAPATLFASLRLDQGEVPSLTLQDPALLN